MTKKLINQKSKLDEVLINTIAVYSSTLFFWLNDESIDNKNTEQFLDRRLKAQIHQQLDLIHH